MINFNQKNTFNKYLLLIGFLLKDSYKEKFWQILKGFIFLFYFFIRALFFFFGSVGSSLLCTGFLQLRRAGSALHCRAWASHCSGFCCCGAWALGARASVVAARRLQSAGSVVVAHGLSCSVACGIFPDQVLNPCPKNWQVDS